MPPGGGIPFGQYTLIRRIARGGMAEVFLANQRGLEGFDRRVAVKRILPHLADAQEFLQMFLAEARLAARLNHPNIVHIYDFGKNGDDYFIAMEFVAGVHVGEIAAITAEKKMPWGLLARIGADCATALHYAHGLTDDNGRRLGLVHRDISPANILIATNGNAKIVDFGIAKAVEIGDSRTNPGMVKGKYTYMSPEQTIGSSLDGRSDVFSLAVVLWEIATGQPMVDREDPGKAMRALRDGTFEPIDKAAPGIPSALAQAISWALEIDRDHRATAADLATALEAYIKASPELAGAMQVADWLRSNFSASVLSGTGEDASEDLEIDRASVKRAPGTALAPATSGSISVANPKKLPMPQTASISTSAAAAALAAAKEKAGAKPSANPSPGPSSVYNPPTSTRKLDSSAGAALIGASLFPPDDDDDDIAPPSDRDRGPQTKHNETVLAAPKGKRSKSMAVQGESLSHSQQPKPAPIAHDRSDLSEEMARTGVFEPSEPQEFDDTMETQRQPKTKIQVVSDDVRTPPVRKLAAIEAQRKDRRDPSERVQVRKDKTIPPPFRNQESAPNKRSDPSMRSESEAQTQSKGTPFSANAPPNVSTPTAIVAPLPPPAKGQSVSQFERVDANRFPSFGQQPQKSGGESNRATSNATQKRVIWPYLVVFGGLFAIAAILFVGWLGKRGSSHGSATTDAAPLLASVDASQERVADAAAPIIDAPSAFDAEVAPDATIALVDPPTPPDVAIIEVSTDPPGGQVTLGDRGGSAPARFETKGGSVLVVAERAGFARKEQTVTAKLGAITRVTVKLTELTANGQQFGSLALRALPEAYVYEGSKSLGKTPLDIDLPVGTHTLSFRAAHFITDTRKIIVKAGKTVTIEVKLVEE